MKASQIVEIETADATHPINWQAQNLPVPRQALCDALEHGKVLFFPNLHFSLDSSEQKLLDPAWADPKRKNISLEPNQGAMHGVHGDEAIQRAARALVARYQTCACEFANSLFPHYRGKLRAAPTSLRLHRVQTRQTSWRKDDSRLHVDAFPSRPNHGERILRIFTNVNPHGEPRVWRVGEPFEDMARRFLPRIKAQTPGVARLLAWLRITKTPRSAYDHLMLHLHDSMKADLEYQKTSPQQTLPFPPGSVWVCFSDQASHAVMSGQFMLEQTFFLPVKAMAHPECAPLGILERLKGHALV